MVNLLKANANELDTYIKENLSKEVSFKFERNELIVLLEGLNVYGLKMIIKMHKNALDKKTNEMITWQYLADPKDPNTTVNRSCRISEMGQNIQEIVENKRFDKVYLQELENTQQ